MVSAREILRSVLIGMKNMFLGGNLLSLTLIHKPLRMGEYVSECIFYYRTIFNKRVIPQKNVFEVIGTNTINEACQINLITNSEYTWFNPYPYLVVDIVSLCLICRFIKPKTVFEIGTMHGYTALHFALNTPEDAIIYTLDLPKKEDIKLEKNITIFDKLGIDMSVRTKNYMFENTDVAHKIKCLYGDSATFDFSPYYGKIDLFFIDGAHSYEYVKSDTMQALKCCRRGGVIAWHDFGRFGINGVSKYLIELYKKGYEIYAVPGGTLAFMVMK